MNIERIGDFSGLKALEPEWRQLEVRLPRLPFLSFDWAAAWWTWLHADGVGVRDEPFLRTFRNPGGELCAVAPLMRTRRPGRGPGLRHLQLFGADPNITEVRSIAASEEDGPAITSALLEHLHASASEWDFMQLSGVPAEWAESLNLTGFRSAQWVHDIPNYYLSLPPSWEEFKTKLSRNIKESLRKCYNAPKRDGIDYNVRVIESPADTREAVNHFLRLHEARSQLDVNVKHKNVFSSEASREFLVDVCSRYAARGKLRIFQLRVNDAVVATRIGFVSEDSLYLYYSGYDPEYSKYSVMTTAVAEALKYAISAGFRTANLSTGNDVSKLRWSPQERTYREVLLVSPSLRGALTHASYAWARNGLESVLSRAPAAAFLSRRT